LKNIRESACFYGTHFLSNFSLRCNTTVVILKLGGFTVKKIAIFALGLVLALNLCACACSNMDPATTPSTTNNTMMPTDTMTVPVPETNIPDPDIGPTGMPENNTTNGANGRVNSVA
jgi:hypothetical protein